MSHVPMTRPEELLALHHTSYFHDSSFAQLDGNRLLHASGDGFNLSEDGGLTWSAEFPGHDTAGNQVGSSCTSLVRLSGQGLGLVGMGIDPAATTPEEKSSSNHLVFWRSDDLGQTWQPPVRITPPGMAHHAYQNVLLRTASGRLVLEIYIFLGQPYGPDNRTIPIWGKLVENQWVSTAAHFYDPHFSAVSVFYSDDEGRTWQRNRDAELMILRDWSTHFSYVSEPSVAEVAPKRLLLFMRTGLGRVFQAWSNDEGETWTRPQPRSAVCPRAICWRYGTRRARRTSGAATPASPRPSAATAVRCGSSSRTSSPCTRRPGWSQDPCVRSPRPNSTLPPASPPPSAMVNTSRPLPNTAAGPTPRSS